jgi:hypothetical protein
MLTESIYMCEVADEAVAFADDAAAGGEDGRDGQQLGQWKNRGGEGGGKEREGYWWQYRPGGPRGSASRGSGSPTHVTAQTAHVLTPTVLIPALQRIYVLLVSLYERCIACMR